jgi:folate-binding protein YgfZ
VIEADHTGEGGYDIYRPTEHLEEFRRRLMAEMGAVPVGEEAAEILRIEAGIPKFGVDMDEKTIPLEAGLEATYISHTKGCYVGQEIIARITARGHTNRTLAGLVLDGTELPRKGEVVKAATGDGEEKETGWITSACLSPSLGSVIALGYVRHENSEPGARVRVVHGEALLSATVTELPFMKRVKP